MRKRNENNFQKTFPNGAKYIADTFMPEHESTLLVGRFNGYFYGKEHMPRHAPFIGWWRFHQNHKKTFFKEGDLIEKVLMQFIRTADENSINRMSQAALEAYLLDNDLPLTGLPIDQMTSGEVEKFVLQNQHLLDW